MILPIGRSLIRRNNKGFNPLEIIKRDRQNKSLTGHVREILSNVAGFTPTPECHVRKGVDEWYSGSGFRPPKERRNHKEDTAAVRPQSFTFVELLVVVILISVISAISVPNLRNTYYNFLLSDTSHNLTYLMRYSQASAIAERANYRLNFDAEYSKYWLTKSADKEGNFVRITGKFGKVFDLSDSITVKTDNTSVKFYPDGKIDKTNIYLSNKNEKFYTITTEAQAGYVQEFDYKKE